MALPQIGLEAVYKDAGFQRGIQQFNDGINKASANAERGASAMSRVGSIAAGALTVGIGAAVTAFGALTAISKIGLDATLQWGEGLDKLGDMFGISGEKASAFQYLANKVGLSVDEMGFGLNTLTRGLQDTADAMKDPKAKATPFMVALQKLGVSAVNSKGKLKTFDEILPQIMDAFKKLPPSINKSDLAMTLFGARGGSKFLDFLSAGSEGLDDATKKVKMLGLELSTTQVNAIEDFGFAMGELKLGLTGIWNTIGIQVLPIARQFVDYLNANIIPRISELAQKYAPILAGALKQVGDVLGYVAEALKGNFSPLYEFIDKVFGREVANNAGNFMLYLQGIATEIGKLGTILKEKGVGEALSAWVSDIAGWLGNSNNTKPITDTLAGWVGKFWQWLTDEKSGLLVTVAQQMENLTTAIRAWSEDPKTLEKLQLIGAGIANTIIDGIGNLFSGAPGQARTDSTMSRLAWALYRASVNLSEAFKNIGASIAVGIADAIGARLLSPDIVNTLYTRLRDLMYAAVRLFVLQDAGPLARMIANAITGAPITPPSPPNHSHEWNPGGASYASGGFVPSTGSAYLHAGEWVLNRAQVMQLAPVLAGANNSRTYNISHTWNGAASSFERREIESTVHAAMAEILGTG